MDKFLNGVKKELNFTLTANGAIAVKSTNNPMVDLYGLIGAARNMNKDKLIELFQNAFEYDALIATKLLFYSRDIRGGLGERKTFRTILKWLANNYPEVAKLNISNVAEFGRYDDLFVLFETPVEQDMLEYIKTQLDADSEADFPTLLAKWMPSENASSYKTKELANKFMSAYHYSPRDYRKLLSRIRAKLNLIETQISSNLWTEIDYSKIPSKAAMQYRQAFWRHTPERYKAYIDSLSKPENVAKINVDTLFPYDIVKKAILDGAWRRGWDYGNTTKFKELYNAQWKALPNLFEDIQDDSLVMADTSGSMTCNNSTPISAALSLAIYFAERNTGRFKNHFMTFSENPELQELKADNLWDNLSGIKSIVANTNIEAAFDLILNTAINEKLEQKDLPGRIIVISDMHFDSATNAYNRKSTKKEVLMDTISKKFEQAGYKMPKLVFWNVNATTSMFPMTEEYGIQFVSGYSQNIFKAIVRNEFLEPINLVLETVNVERYNCIVVQ